MDWLILNLYLTGTLAEKALLAVLPPEDDCPYTVRINAEVMASDGSTSMASVCAGRYLTDYILTLEVSTIRVILCSGISLPKW